MLKGYLVKTYAYLVKVGAWDLEPQETTEGEQVTQPVKKVVPDNYREAVAEYLASQESPITTNQTNTEAK